MVDFENSNDENVESTIEHRNDEWINRIRSMEKLDRSLFTRKETFYSIQFESEKEIREISKIRFPNR